MKLFSKTRPVQTVCCSIDCETLNGINEIARQLKRLADAWEGTGKPEKTENLLIGSTSADIRIA